MTEFKALTSEQLKNLTDDDPGIDFENYSFEEELEKVKGYHVRGYFGILVRIHIEPPVVKTAGGVYLPDSTTDRMHVNTKFTRPVGLALKFSPGVYQDGERYKLTGPLCKPGDWINFQRNDIRAFQYKKMALGWLPDELVLGVVEDPRDIGKL